MGIITVVKTVKEIHTDSVILIKIGKFYNIYGKDAYIISYLFVYAIKEVEGIKTCGFPSTSFNKVIAKLENNKINYMVLDRRNNYDIDLKYDNNNLNNYIRYFEKAKKYVNYKIRIDNVNKFMLDNINKKDFKNIITKVENIIINERRKIQSN